MEDELMQKSKRHAVLSAKNSIGGLTVLESEELKLLTKYLLDSLPAPAGMNEIEYRDAVARILAMVKTP